MTQETLMKRSFIAMAVLLVTCVHTVCFGDITIDIVHDISSMPEITTVTGGGSFDFVAIGIDSTTCTPFATSGGFIGLNSLLVGVGSGMRCRAADLIPSAYGGPSPGIVANAGTTGSQPFGISQDFLVLPAGYTSGSALTASQSQFSGSTLTSLGLTIGSYEWSWILNENGTVTEEKIIVNVSTVPEPSSGVLLALLCVVAGVRRRYLPVR